MYYNVNATKRLDRKKDVTLIKHQTQKRIVLF